MDNFVEHEVTIEVNSKQVNPIPNKFNCKRKENILKGKII